MALHIFVFYLLVLHEVYFNYYNFCELIQESRINFIVCSPRSFIYISITTFCVMFIYTTTRFNNVISVKSRNIILLCTVYTSILAALVATIKQVFYSDILWIKPELYVNLNVYLWRIIRIPLLYVEDMLFDLVAVLCATFADVFPNGTLNHLYEVLTVLVPRLVCGLWTLCISVYWLMEKFRIFYQRFSLYVFWTAIMARIFVDRVSGIRRVFLMQYVLWTNIMGWVFLLCCIIENVVRTIVTVQRQELFDLEQRRYERRKDEHRKHHAQWYVMLTPAFRKWCVNRTQWIESFDQQVNSKLECITVLEWRHYVATLNRELGSEELQFDEYYNRLYALGNCSQYEIDIALLCTSFIPQSDSLDKDELKGLKIARKKGKGMIVEVSRKGTRSTKNKYKDRRCHQGQSSNILAAEFSIQEFTDGRGFTQAPKYNDDLTWSLDMNLSVFEDYQWRGILLNQFLMTLRFRDVFELIGSYLLYNPTHFKSQEHSLKFLTFKRQLNEVKSRWHVSEEGVSQLRDFLASIQTVYSELDIEKHSYVLPEHVVHLDHPTVRFPDIPEKHFVCESTRKGKVGTPLLQVSFSPNCLYDLVSKCTSKCNMMTLQKIKSILRQQLLEEKSDEQILELIGDKCYQWRKQDTVALEQEKKSKRKLKREKKTNKGDGDVKLLEPNYSKLSWCVPYIPAKWLYYEVENDSEYMVVFSRLMLELRANILTFSKKYLENSRLTTAERKAQSKVQSKAFASFMRSPDIQERFAAGEDKKDICQDIFMKKTKEISKMTEASDTVVNQKLEVRKVRQKSVMRERSIKQERNDYDCFIPESWATVVNTAAFPLFLVLVYYQLLKPWWEKFQPQADKLTKEVMKTIEDANKTLITVNKSVEVTSNVIDDMQDMYFGKNCKPEYKIMAMDIKILIHCIYDAINKDFKGLIRGLSDFSLLHPEMIQQLIETIHNNMNYVVKRVSSVSFTWRGKKQRVRADQFEDFLNNPDENEVIQDEEFETQGFTEDCLAPFMSIINVFRSGSMSPQEMRDANTRSQYVFYNSKFWTDQSTMIKGISSYIGRELFDYDPFNPGHSEFTQTIVSTIEYIDRVILRENDFVIDLDLCREVINKHQEAILSKNSPRMDTISGALRTHFNQRFLVLERLSCKADPILKGICERIEPQSCMWMGRAKAGKTAAMKYTCKALRHFEGKVFMPTDIYTMKADSPYWDGYMYHWCVQHDDIFKELDPMTRQNSACQFMGCIGNAPYFLNMAECEAKGKVAFNSSYYFLTTNIGLKGYATCNLVANLENNEAFWRRVHNILYKEEKFERPQNIWEQRFRFEKCEYMPDVVGQWKTMKEIVEILYRCRQRQIREYNDFTITHEQLVALHADFVPESYTSSMDLYIKRYASLFKLPSLPMMFKGFSILVGGAALSYGLYQVYARFNPPPEIVNVESYPEEDWNQKRIKVKPKLRKPKIIQVDRTFRQQSDGSTFIKACVALARGAVYIEIQAKDRDHTRLDKSQGFHLKDGLIVATGHVILPYKDMDVDIYVKWATGEQRWSIPTDFLRATGEDLIVFPLEIRANCPKMCFSHIITEETITDIPAGEAMSLLLVNSEGVCSTKNVNKHSEGNDVHYDCDETHYIISNPITYFGNTAGGESGALLVRCGHQGRPFIVGMHAGKKTTKTTEFAAAIPLSQESFKEILEMSLEFFKPQNCATFPMEILREVPMSEAHYPPLKNSIKPTRLFNWHGDPHKVPARMRPFVHKENGETVNPPIKALTKLIQEPETDVAIPESAFKWFENMYSSSDGRVLTYDEALNGIPGRIPSIVHSTSPGYPYNLKHTQGKAPYIVKNGDRMEYQPEFKVELEKYHEKLQRLEQIEAYFCVMYKNECVSWEKYNDGRTRLFAASPLHYTILARMYFLDFAMYVQSKAATHPVSVGIDPHSLDWTILYKRLKRKGLSIISGDFKNYDGSIRRSLIQAYCRAVNKWYDDGPINARIRELLVELLFSSTFILYQFIFQVTRGNPSGNPFTSIMNSVCLMFLLYTILTLYFGLSEEEFELAVYGDDNLIAIARLGITCAMIASAIWQHFGMIYTHSSKKEVYQEDTMETIVYLGRLFALRSSVVMAPLNENVIIESTYWYAKTEESIAIVSTLQSFMIEASHLSEQRFEELRDECLEAVKERTPELYDVVCRQTHTYSYYYKAKYVPGMHVNFKFKIQSQQSSFIDAQDYLNGEGNFECQSWRHTKSIVGIFPENNVSETRNEDLTNRGPNETDGSQEERIGEFVDVNPVAYSASSMSIMQTIHGTFNMERYILDRNFTREYNVANYTVTSGQALGYQIGVLNFPYALFQFPFIQAMIGYFMYYRAGIRISVRSSASKFDYGCIMIDDYPYKMGADTNADTIYTRSGREHALYFWEQSGALIMDLPFIHPQRALNTLSYQADEMHCVTFSVVSPLANINGTSESVTLSVFAEFIEPEAYMPLNVNDLSVGGADPGYTFVPHSEANNKAKNNSFSSTFETAARVAGNIIAPRLTRGIMEVKRAMGLDKPMSVDVNNTPRISYLQTDFYGKGISLTKCGGVDPENAVSTDPIIASNSDDMLIAKIAGTPQMTQAFNLYSTTSPFSVIDLWKDSAYENYDAFISNMFRWRSGGYKFKIYFSCSLMHSARIVLWLGVTTGSGSSGNWQNCYHKFIEVSGTTEASFFVPYPYGAIVQATTTAASTGFSIYAQVVSWSQPVSTATTPIYMIIYKSAAEDVKYYAPISVEYTFTPESFPRKDFSIPFEPFNPSFTAYAHKGVVCGEEILTLRDMCHIMWAQQPATAGASINPSPVWTYGVSNVVLSGPPLFELMFLFKRGSYRLKVITQDGTRNVACMIHNSGQYAPTADMINGSVPVMEMSIPFYTYNAFQAIRQDADVYPNMITAANGGASTYYLHGCGDDFSLMYIFPPPPGSFSSPASTLGFVGLRTFFA